MPNLDLLDDGVLEALRTDGLAVVEGWLDDVELKASLDLIDRFYPTWDEYARAEAQSDTIANSMPTHWAFTEFPDFPSELHFNVLRPDLIDFARRFIGGDVLATQSGISAKYAGQHVIDQELHTDTTNHSLVWAPQDYLAGMIYYTDVTAENGPTYAVSRRHTANTPMYPRHRSRDLDPDLYEHELPILAPAGSLLLYTMSTFHRGSGMTAATGRRVNHHWAYRPVKVDHIGWAPWPMRAANPEMSRLLQLCSVEQRTAMGFPAPGDPYWTDVTLDGVALRYPDMDLLPYGFAR